MEKEVNKDIGLRMKILSLTSFLNTGFATENFNLCGKIPEEWALLHIYAKGELINRALSFRILTEISSYP
jgi:hypothetical protein